ncbi:transketolase [Parasphingopyxis lamellibrachiae]|uniref:Transketolase n=1 Tax=Parasphingopyxis lamellibrachiae TaxID=680125 RepID=A0A3D9FE81_9SPHN|nr:transketolase [Parasphingopyxis lamellibrachiae]RED15351.1 transketolase [Parasphingopyxis lamellibrachiae]
MTVSQTQLANAIRALSMDAVQEANSGHPGMPMGMADVATVLFTKYLKYNPQASEWFDRDRFVLSAGHGSMLIYSLLHLTGYARPTMDEIKHFRQLGSPCAGHPENFLLPGVEATTGPLGQGLAMAVGMAIAERHLNAQFGDDVIDHRTWVIAGDGCLMEGINHETIGLAGHLQLGRLITFWDDNDITIDGGTDLSTSENVPARYEAAGWHVTKCDGHDPDAIRFAIEEALADPRPSLIACKTVIGYGAPNKQGTSATHGAPLGDEEIAAARKELGWDAAPFVIPPEIGEAWQAAGARSAEVHGEWLERLANHPEKAELERRIAGDLPEGHAMQAYLETLAAEPPKVATRKASEMALTAINKALPDTLGGSADLTGSNNTKTPATEPLTKDDYGGRYIYYGIREFGMAAAMNGMALHGGVIPYGGTFLVFADYCRPAIRLAALQRVRSIFVMTHDSIGLGEDGPTHQPIEHLASLRAMPGLDVYRPCDAIETAECWALSLKRKDGPSLHALTRQGLPPMRSDVSENLSAKGAYRLRSAENARKVVLLASGSEVHLAADIAKALEAKGIGADVVSMPCWELFEAQDAAYKADILGSQENVLRVSIEAGATFGWERYTGSDGMNFGIDRFGGSAPADKLFEYFGLTEAAITPQILSALKN